MNTAWAGIIGGGGLRVWAVAVQWDDDGWQWCNGVDAATRWRLPVCRAR